MQLSGTYKLTSLNHKQLVGSWIVVICGAFLCSSFSKKSIMAIELLVRIPIGAASCPPLLNEISQAHKLCYLLSLFFQVYDVEDNSSQAGVYGGVEPPEFPDIPRHRSQKSIIPFAVILGVCFVTIVILLVVLACIFFGGRKQA